MLQDLVATYGYAALFGLVFLESMGVPLPGETALLTAAALAASGRLEIESVVLAAAAGAIGGDAAGFWLGRTGGLSLLRRYGRLVRLDEHALERGRAFFRRHGAKAVFLGRFVALLRMMAALLAGVMHMPYARFTVYNVAGGLCWSLLFGALGYAFGLSLPQLERWIGHAEVLAALALALVLTLPFAGRWLIQHRRKGPERKPSEQLD